MHQSIWRKDHDKENYHVIMVISDKARFEKENHAGAIYILPMQDFKYDEIKGFGIYEWTSKKSVKPWVQISFSSALDAVQTMEV